MKCPVCFKRLVRKKSIYCNKFCYGKFLSTKKPWNAGKICPSISLGRLGVKHSKKHTLTSETKFRMRMAKLGKKKSAETRMKMSLAKKGCVPWIKGKKHSEEAKKLMLQGSLKGAKTLYERRPTSIEIKVYEALKAKGFLFETQKIINGKFVVDAYIPSLNLIIEVDGDYWHGLDRIKKKDKAENAYLRKCGYGLLRLGEKDIPNFEANINLYVKGGGEKN